jgi:hypothetical protein
MNQSNPAEKALKVVGVAGGTALIAPVAPPILHGLAGIAVVGIGLFAAGSLVMKVAESLTGIENPLKNPGANKQPR